MSYQADEAYHKYNCTESGIVTGDGLNRSNEMWKLNCARHSSVCSPACPCSFPERGATCCCSGTKGCLDAGGTPPPPSFAARVNRGDG
jgi:hypothetical protein